MNQVNSFKATLKIIGINPYVSLPAKILNNIFKEAGKVKGPIPVKGTVNKNVYQQTLIKYKGEWRLYINTKMLEQSPKRIGETIAISIAVDTANREIKAPPKFLKTLKVNKIAQHVFNSLPASRQKEIVRYLANLKTQEALDKNIIRAINFLQGNDRFIGRDKP